MKRAAILIGVDKTGGLPKLNDASRGARRMEQWAIGQQMDPVVVITDEGGKPVAVSDITKAITQIVKKGTTEQLIVYFAGHGINVGFAERWLLTDAPEDSNAAVNLNGSAERAHHCGIPYVVFVSDACRTAAEGIQAQGVEGSIVFPNDPGAGPENAVDRFWACLVGNPAAEVRDPAVPASEYQAIYTGELLDALAGKKPQVTEADGDSAVIRPRPLKPFMRDAMAARLKNLNLQTKLIQVPDARITSDEQAWISRVAAGGRKGLGLRAPAVPIPDTPNLESISTSLFRSAVAARNLELQDVRADRVQGGQSLVKAATRAAQPFEAVHFEGDCGFRLRGARFAEAFSKGARVTVVGEELVRIEAIVRAAASVLLVFNNGNGVALPAIANFIAALSVEDGGLVDVAYEPSDKSYRWNDFVGRAEELRALRAIAASSTRSGVFRLEGDDAIALAQRMQYSKGVDPSLAVYAAYAYLDLRRRDRISDMSQFMRADLGARLFDVAMLAGQLDGKALRKDDDVVPFMPLLSQGWALISAYRIKLPAALDGIAGNLLPAVWTTLNPQGVSVVRDLIMRGEVQ